SQVPTNNPPVLASISDQTGIAEQELTFTISATDTEDDEGKLAYSATGLPFGANLDTVTGIFTWTSTTAGTYQVTFKVTDTGGLSDTKQITLTVSQASVNQAPIASFSATSSGLTANVDAAASSDDKSGLQFRWDWNNDGNYDSSYSSTKTAIHTYTAAGTYSIKLEIKDSEGLTNSITHSVIILGGDNVGAVIAYGPCESKDVDTKACSDNMLVQCTRTRGTGVFIWNIKETCTYGCGVGVNGDFICNPAPKPVLQLTSSLGISLKPTSTINGLSDYIPGSDGEVNMVCNANGKKEYSTFCASIDVDGFGTVKIGDEGEYSSDLDISGKITDASGNIIKEFNQQHVKEFIGWGEVIRSFLKINLDKDLSSGNYKLEITIKDNLNNDNTKNSFNTLKEFKIGSLPEIKEGNYCNPSRYVSGCDAVVSKRIMSCNVDTNKWYHNDNTVGCSVNNQKCQMTIINGMWFGECK
ncbi:MAG: putative Ig domain-containing protein, partial [Patescibacteria group bacterium]